MPFEEAEDIFMILTGYPEDIDEAFIIFSEEEDDELTVSAQMGDKTLTLRPATLPELVWEDEDGKKMVDGILDTFSESRFQLALERAEKEFGGLAPDDEDTESEFYLNFFEEYEKQLTKMALSDLLDYYVKEGIIEITGVDENGLHIYESVDPDVEIANII